MSAGKLQLTNGYSVDFGEIARFVSTVQRDGRAKIPLADIANAGGFALRQAENLGSISQAFGLVEPRVLRLLPLGKITAAHDRFFDDVGTLWFLHYVIASQPRHIVWNRFATDLVIRPGGFTKDEFNGAFGDLAVTHSASSANKPLPGLFCVRKPLNSPPFCRTWRRAQGSVSDSAKGPIRHAKS